MLYAAYLLYQYIQELINNQEPSPDGEVVSPLEKEIKVPILGKINLSNLSPLFLSILLGALDGFNACAMVALGFLLAVLELALINASLDENTHNVFFPS